MARTGCPYCEVPDCVGVRRHVPRVEPVEVSPVVATVARVVGCLVASFVLAVVVLGPSTILIGLTTLAVLLIR